jgi:hypothetical protein
MPENAVVNLDLDALEREQVRGVPKRRDPYTARIDGRVVAFADPMDIDASVLMVMEETPGRFFKATLSGDGDDSDYAHVIEAYQTPGKITGLKLRALMGGYRTYYGLDDPGNEGGSRR